MDELKHVDVWRGEHCGLTFEIKKWSTKGSSEYGISPKDNWNYYVYFTSHSLPKDVFEQITDGIHKVRYGCNYYDSPISSLDWHGGCTFGELTHDHENNLICFKAGCDYSHIWDEGCEYFLEDLIGDAKVTIDHFMDRFPEANPIAPPKEE